jgi:zinc finger BED domain-containing protein 1 (E3 SUMO-protein ligase ZBED1)
LTTDSWTSVCTESYIALTAHYLTADFHSGSLLLEFVKYSDHHMAENLCTELRRVIRDWDIGKKVVAVVTDNVAYITAAVRLASLKHLPCFAHTLNLVVQKALKAIVTIKKKLKLSWNISGEALWRQKSSGRFRSRCGLAKRH